MQEHRERMQDGWRKTNPQNKHKEEDREGLKVSNADSFQVIGQRQDES